MCGTRQGADGQNDALLSKPRSGAERAQLRRRGQLAFTRPPFSARAGAQGGARACSPKMHEDQLDRLGFENDRDDPSSPPQFWNRRRSRCAARKLTAAKVCSWPILLKNSVRELERAALRKSISQIDRDLGKGRVIPENASESERLEFFNRIGRDRAFVARADS